METILGIIIGAVITAVIYEERDRRRKAKAARARRHRDIVLAQQQQRQLRPAKDPNATVWSAEAQLAERIRAMKEKSNNAQ
jgi:uncharacterized membrane protein YccC